MKAFRLHDGASEGVLDDIAVPDPGPDEVRIRVAAAGLNFADLLILKGQYQDLPPLPATLGLEGAGTVDAVGENVTSPTPGTRVAVFAGHGMLAEYAICPADRCLPIPDAMPFDVAAGFQIAYGTSHLALTRTARLRPSETLLVLGAGGGVGLTAVEVGATLGARVIAAARGSDKLEAARAAGAAEVIDTTTDDIRDRVRAAGGADVVYDAVGGDAFTAALRATKPEGRILAIGFASGTVPQIPANHLLVKNISVHGFYWGGFLKFAPDAIHDSLTMLVDWWSDGRLKPHIGETLPLSRTSEGLQRLRDRRATGKVVILI